MDRLHRQCVCSTMRHALLAPVLASLACGRAAPPAPSSPAPPAAPATAAGPASIEPEAPASDRSALEGTIVEEGPLGHGACTQKSYRVQPPEGEPLWVHFERCGDAAGPDFSALRVGAGYRFTVAYGASRNFGDAPMIVDAQALRP